MPRPELGRGHATARVHNASSAARVTGWPLAARAQQVGKVWRIGFFGAPLDVPSISAEYQAFLAQLRELGFSEGQNLNVEYRRYDGARGPQR